MNYFYVIKLDKNTNILETFFMAHCHHFKTNIKFTLQSRLSKLKYSNLIEFVYSKLSTVCKRNEKLDKT